MNTRCLWTQSWNRLTSRCRHFGLYAWYSQSRFWINFNYIFLALAHWLLGGLTTKPPVLSCGDRGRTNFKIPTRHKLFVLFGRIPANIIYCHPQLFVGIYYVPTLWLFCQSRSCRSCMVWHFFDGQLPLYYTNSSRPQDLSVFVPRIRREIKSRLLDAQSCSLSKSLGNVMLVKSLDCIFHSYEWERSSSFWCTVFGVETMQAQLNGSVISIETKPSNPDSEFVSASLVAVFWCNDPEMVDLESSAPGLFSSTASPSKKKAAASTRSVKIQLKHTDQSACWYRFQLTVNMLILSFWL